MSHFFLSGTDVLSTELNLTLELNHTGNTSTKESQRLACTDLILIIF